MFPPGKSFFLAKKDGASTPNYLMFRSLNLISLLQLPIPEMAQFKLEDIPDYAQISTDGIPLSINIDRFKDDIEFWYEGICYGWEYFEQVKKGTAEQFTIIMGKPTTLLVRITDDLHHLTTLGSHTFDIKINFYGYTCSISVPLELFEENMNIIFDPKDT